MHASAWVDWQLSDPAENWRTIVADHKKQTFSYAPRFYMHATFSRAIRPGSRFIDSDNSNTLAAIREDGSLVLVALNTGSSDAKYTFDLSKFESIGNKVKVHRFTLPAALKVDSDISVSGKSFTVTAAAQSIVTMVIENATGGVCVPSEIIPYAKIHDGGWNETTEVKVNPGDSLVIGPHPYDGGRWTWKGPNDFYYLGREVRFKDMQWQSSGIYTGTYVNPYGCESSVKIKVIVDDPAHPYVEPVDPDTGTTKLIPQIASSIQQNITVKKSGGDLLISAPSQTLQLSIYDLQGTLMMRRQINGTATIPVEQFSQKPYVVKINSAGNKVYQKIFR
jgi:hypothetical protein